MKRKLRFELDDPGGYIGHVEFESDERGAFPDHWLPIIEDLRESLRGGATLAIEIEGRNYSGVRAISETASI